MCSAPMSFSESVDEDVAKDFYRTLQGRSTTAKREGKKLSADGINSDARDLTLDDNVEPRKRQALGT